MFDPQVGGVKKGVILVNQRIFIPEHLSALTKVEQFEFIPMLRSISVDQADLQYTGTCLFRVVYSTAKPINTPERFLSWDGVNSAERAHGKEFFDDGFSDHDEFAEEEVILSDEILLPNRTNFILETVTFEDTFVFSGCSPLDDSNVPALENLTIRSVEAELKARDERTLDISAVLLISQEQDLEQQEWLIRSGEFQQPLTLLSWPPGMAEVVQWHCAYRENKLLLRDNEILLTGELYIQIVGLEKEGDERVFTAINTTSPLSWTLDLPAEIKREAIQGIRVITENVVESPQGLSIQGALYLDMDSANMLDGAEIAEDINVEQDSAADMNVEQDSAEEMNVEQSIEAIKQVDDTAAQALDRLVEDSAVAEPEQLIEDIGVAVSEKQIEEPAQVENNLEWLREWADSGDISENNENQRTNNNENHGAALDDLLNSETVPELVGTYSGEVDPESEELLRSFDLNLSDIPTLEEVMADHEKTDLSELTVTPKLTTPPEIKYNLQYTDSIKVRTASPETEVRKGLTNLKYLQRIATSDEIIELNKPVQESEASAARPAAKGRWTLYRVKVGDTVPGICRQYGISEELLKIKNNLNSDQIEPSSMIWIPK